MTAPLNPLAKRCKAEIVDQVITDNLNQALMSKLSAKQRKNIIFVQDGDNDQ